jgi:hypothetical protein
MGRAFELWGKGENETLVKQWHAFTRIEKDIVMHGYEVKDQPEAN